MELVPARLRVAIADDDPAYELFNSYQRAQLAYQTAMKALARHTGYNVRQVAKFMQSRRRAQKQD